MTSTLPPLVQAFSGSLGSATANAIVYPLDLVTTRLQTTSSRKLRGFRGIFLALQHILRSEGWNGLCDGLGTDTAATLLSNFLYFFFYTSLRTILVRRKGTHRLKSKAPPALLSVLEELGIGFFAGIASRAISTPLSVVTVRLQTKTEGEDEDGELNAEKGSPAEAERLRVPRGVGGTVRRIYEDQGLTGFWGGFTTTIPLSLNPAITLFLFQLFGKITAGRGTSRKSRLGTPNAVQSFFGAACSNTIATTILYPLMLAKTRLQVHAKGLSQSKDAGTQEQDHENMVSIWRKALQKDGLRGLYQGLEGQLAKGFVSEGVTMMVKQRIELYIVALYLHILRWI